VCHTTPGLTDIKKKRRGSYGKTIKNISSIEYYGAYVMASMPRTPLCTTRASGKTCPQLPPAICKHAELLLEVQGFWIRVQGLEISSFGSKVSDRRTHPPPWGRVLGASLTFLRLIHTRKASEFPIAPPTRTTHTAGSGAACHR